MSELIKVASTSPTTAVAGAIAGVIRGKGAAWVQAIGAGAVHQAVKSVAIARLYLQEDGLNIVCIPSFVTVAIGGGERTAVRLEVFSLSDQPLPGHGDKEEIGSDEVDNEVNEVAENEAAEHHVQHAERLQEEDELDPNADAT